MNKSSDNESVPSSLVSGGRVPKPSAVAAVFLSFLKLGLTSFGGPVAHLGYFRSEFVNKLKWFDEDEFADLVALCQFLPGPASSQLGMAIGLARAGWIGAVAAWSAFTLPSAIALIFFGYELNRLTANAISGPVHGLKLAAVAIVAHAIWKMSKTLCPDRGRAGIAFFAAALALILPTGIGQIGAIFSGAVAGRLWLEPKFTTSYVERDYGVSRRVGATCLILFSVLLVAIPAASIAWSSPLLAAFGTFYKSGALVFGGGHVVLPLLQVGVVPTGWMSNDTFLAGYGAAQAVPGPLFAFAAYLGSVMRSPLGGWGGGFLLLFAIFLPAALLVVGALPFWHELRRRQAWQQALSGVNAAVVGVLLAAFYDPVWLSAIHSRVDVALGLAAFCTLLLTRISPIFVVLALAAAGFILAS